METNELINQLREQLADALAKNEVLEAEFELALDMAERCCNAESKDDALAIRQKFISETSFESTQGVLAGLKQKIKSLTTERNELKDCVIGMAFYMENSDGIAGWHQNGDVAEWDSLDLSMEDHLAVKNTFALEQQVKGIDTCITVLQGCYLVALNENCDIDDANSIEVLVDHLEKVKDDVLNQLQAQGESK